MRLHTILIVPLLSFFCNPSLSMVSLPSVTENVIPLPFVTLHSERRELHIIKDYFRLVQHVNLAPLANHIVSIKQGYQRVQGCFRNQNESFFALDTNLEGKITFLLNNLAQTLQAGTMLLPHQQACLRKRRKRSYQLDEDPVNTLALFPSVGKVFSWITGSLSADAGKYINLNYNNVKRLTKMSVKFAQMFNSTLNIERKHEKQMLSLKAEIENTSEKLSTDINKLEKTLTYQNFLQNMIVIIEDLQRTLDLIFEHTDAIELNKMGPLSRDPVFLKAIGTLISDGVKSKKNNLYLMKIASKIDIEVCHLSIIIAYKFPILKHETFVPRRTISVPKLIKDKYFSLAKDIVPFMITWSSEVYMFSKEEYDRCQSFNRQLICQKPKTVIPLMENCIFSLMNKVPVKALAKICPLDYIQSPSTFVTITESHVVYSIIGDRIYITIICNDISKVMPLEGSGIIEIPSGCRVDVNGKTTYRLGHLARSADVSVNMDDSVWRLNFTEFLPLLKVNNVANVSELWQLDIDDERVIEEGIMSTINLMQYIKFSPSGITYTLWSLIAYTVVTTILVILALYLVCVPGAPLYCKTKCCGCC